jgi:copper chaperone NosL
VKLMLMTNEGTERPEYALAGGVERAWQRPVGFRWLCLSLSFLFLASCNKSATGPVAIAQEDTCRYCKMAISEKRYAAEFIDRDGGAFKFDDIGCLINFIKDQQNKDQIAAYFVIDFEERQWIKGADAYFVRSSEFKTPMAGSIVAFKDEAKAELAAGKYHGKLLRFTDLFP